MNCQELSWALSAALPHAGKGKIGGLWLEQRNGVLYVYATDSYTIGIAAVEGASTALRAKLSAKEAAELERWVRPAYVAERELAVFYAVRDNELHIADGNDESAVFELEDPDASSLDALWELVGKAKAAKPEAARPVGIQPAFMARFVKAGEKVRIEFKQWGTKMGALLVEAPNFDGLAANLAYWATPEPANLQIPLAS